MISNGFGQGQTAYTVTIVWKHGFKHSYEQKLNDKQLESEQERIKNLRCVEKVEFTPLT